MVQVNQFFKPPNYIPGRISSKTSRKVVQKNCEVMSTFHITENVFHIALRQCEISNAECRISTENVFHIALRQCETHSLAPPSESLKLSLLHSIVFHIALRQLETHLVCLSCFAESATEALFLLHSIVFHVCFTSP